MSFLIGMLPLLVSIHEDDSHDEEANVSQEDQYHWSKDGPHKRCVRTQIATMKKKSYSVAKFNLRQLQKSLTPVHSHSHKDGAFCSVQF